MGLDRLSNAGKQGSWYGIVCGRNGKPYIQGIDAPAYANDTNGFYVSPTAHVADTSRRENDPHRYVNSEEVPYIVIPGGFPIHNLLGKPAIVSNDENGLFCHAIVADIGPQDSIGEGSIALANALGIDPDCRTGGKSSGVSYMLFLS